MSEKFYRSIKEISLYNWVQICNGNVEFILKDTNDISLIKNQDELDNAWNDLYDDFLKERGISRYNLNLYREMKQLAILECDYVITSDAFKLTQIEIQKEKINLLKKSNNGISTEKSLIYLSKWLGFRVNWKEISVNEYYLMLDEYGKANKE